MNPSGLKMKAEERRGKKTADKKSRKMFLKTIAIGSVMVLFG